MITAVQAAQLACIDIYAPASDIQTISGVTFSVVKVGDDTVIVFRGSKTEGDWRRDFLAIAIHVDGLGHVHRGFYSGLTDVLTAIKPTLPNNVYVCGHSLGAAEAPIFAMMLNNAGITVKGCFMFAPPRPGYEDFRDTLDLTGIPLYAWHNAGDPVPDWPEPILPLLDWASVCQNIPIAVPPTSDDLEPLRCHHGRLYYQGVSA